MSGASSKTSAVLAAGALSVVLAAAGIVDQGGAQSLVHHANTVYASSGKQPTSGVLYGLLYTVAAVDAVLWLAVWGVVRFRRRLGGALAVVTVVVSASLGVTLLAASEYGSRIFPPVWGILALLPAVAGLLSLTPLLRRDRLGAR